MLSRNAVGAPRKRRLPAWMMWAALLLVAGLGMMRGGSGGRSYGAGFSEREAELLFERGHGAQARVQVLYHQLLGTGSVPVPPPIAAEQRGFPRVALRDLDRDVTVGELWLDPANALYEFLDIVRKGFPIAPYGGVEAPLPALAREHEENALRCVYRVERLRRLSREAPPLPPGGAAAKAVAAKLAGAPPRPEGMDLGASFGGHGARLIAAYGEACRAADFAAAAARADDPQRYRDAVLVAARAMNDATAVFGVAR